MDNEIKDANLELLIGLQQHLDQAAILRTLLDRLLSLAKVPTCHPKPKKEKCHELAVNRTVAD
jgi:hypothetical protein